MHRNNFKVNGPGHLTLKEKKKNCYNQFLIFLPNCLPFFPIASRSVISIPFPHQTITLSSGSLKFIAVLMAVIMGICFFPAGPHADIFTCSAVCKIYASCVLAGEVKELPRYKEILGFHEKERYKSRLCFLHILPDAGGWCLWMHLYAIISVSLGSVQSHSWKAEIPALFPFLQLQNVIASAGQVGSGAVAFRGDRAGGIGARVEPCYTFRMICS